MDIVVCFLMIVYVWFYKLVDVRILIKFVIRIVIGDIMGDWLWRIILLDFIDENGLGWIFNV